MTIDDLWGDDRTTPAIDDLWGDDRTTPAIDDLWGDDRLAPVIDFYSERAKRRPHHEPWGSW